MADPIQQISDNTTFLLGLLEGCEGGRGAGSVRDAPCPAAVLLQGTRGLEGGPKICKKYRHNVYLPGQFGGKQRGWVLSFFAVFPIGLFPDFTSRSRW